jgi:hypothetical protein
VVVRVTLNPALGKDGVEIDVFRERDQEKTVLKPISTLEAGRVIEYFKD